MDKLKLVEVEKTVESIPLGTKDYYSKTITEADVALFASITGDSNQLSTNEAFAKTTIEGRCPVQRELIASYTWPVSTAVTSPGAVTIGQEINFYKSAYVGDTITVVGEVNEKNMEKKFVYLHVDIYNQADELLADGYVLNLMRMH